MSMRSPAAPRRSGETADSSPPEEAARWRPSATCRELVAPWAAPMTVASRSAALDSDRRASRSMPEGVYNAFGSYFLFRF